MVYGIFIRQKGLMYLCWCMCILLYNNSSGISLYQPKLIGLFIILVCTSFGQRTDL